MHHRPRRLTFAALLALAWWETTAIPYKDERGVWCLGTTGSAAKGSA